MTKLGFERPACQHSYVFREMGGVAFRCCESCGQTHLLWQFDNGEMALLPVAEADKRQWARVRKEQKQPVGEQADQGEPGNAD